MPGTNNQASLLATHINLNGELGMRSLLISATAAALMAAVNTAALAQVKQVPYPAVKVKLAEAYLPDAAFQKMQISFAQASAAKDTQALLSLVGPTFLWMSRGELNDQFNFGRGAVDNFTAVFGFAESENTTGGVAANGPLWDILAAFAADKSFYTATDTLVCGPTSATIVDDDEFNSAKKKISADASVEWYFTVADTPATSTPTDAGSPVGQVSQVALPVLSVFPLAKDGQPKPPVTHLQVLLPSGKIGWIPIAAAFPLVTDRLCYAVTSDGSWKFAAFDQAE
jgi:hypothetical protein